MRTVTMSPPTLAFVIGTRAALAFGVGLLAASRLRESRRRSVARALVAVGALTTIPAALAVRRQTRRSRSA